MTDLRKLPTASSLKGTRNLIGPGLLVVAVCLSPPVLAFRPWLAPDAKDSLESVATPTPLVCGQSGAETWSQVDRVLDAAIAAIKVERWDLATSLLRGAATEYPGTPASYLQEQVELLSQDRAAIESAQVSSLTWFNVGCGYHNIFLFARSRDRTGWAPFYLKAQHAYHRALQVSPCSGQSRYVLVCLAALYQETGRVDLAHHVMDQVDENRIHEALGMTYLAYYYSSARQSDQALEWLRRACGKDPIGVRRWASKSNDFDNIRHDPRFVALIGAGEARADPAKELIW